VDKHLFAHSDTDERNALHRLATQCAQRVVAWYKKEEGKKK
jgi:hypothetical protein